MHVKGGMQDQLNQFYGSDTKQGKAWNRVQVKVRKVIRLVTYCFHKP